MPLRIAVLECDTPVPKVDAKYHGYAGVFRSLLHKSAVALNEPNELNPDTGLEISSFDVVNGTEYPKLEDVDAVLLTGSSALPNIFALWAQYGIPLADFGVQSTILTKTSLGSIGSLNSPRKSFIMTVYDWLGSALDIRLSGALLEPRSV